MSCFQVDRQALWSGRGLVMVGLCVLLGFLLFRSGEWSRHPRYIPREEVWAVVKREAAKHDLDPRFVFAIVAAESSFNARARNGDARGLMQIRRIAWMEVSEKPHRDAWDWAENIVAGTAYLAHLKKFLEQEKHFSYPVLAACYRHGPYRIKGIGFQLNELPAPSNEIYRALQSGNPASVAVPPQG